MQRWARLTRVRPLGAKKKKTPPTTTTATASRALREVKHQEFASAASISQSVSSASIPGPRLVLAGPYRGQRVIQIRELNAQQVSVCINDSSDTTAKLVPMKRSDLGTDARSDLVLESDFLFAHNYSRFECMVKQAAIGDRIFFYNPRTGQVHKSSTITNVVRTPSPGDSRLIYLEAATTAGISTIVVPKLVMHWEQASAAERQQALAMASSSSSSSQLPAAAQLSVSIKALCAQVLLS
jgi:hypothetical protein